MLTDTQVLGFITSSLYTEPERGAEVQSSFRPPELQDAKKVIMDFLPNDTKNKLLTNLEAYLFYLFICKGRVQKNIDSCISSV